jgi:hypothetical protein
MGNCGDPVNHPSHYTFGAIEVIDALEAWNLGYHLGNVIKYVVRSRHKGNYLEDLQKARWYLEREIQRAHNELRKLDEQTGTVHSGTLIGSPIEDIRLPAPLTCARCGRAMYEGHRHDCIPRVAGTATGGDLPVQVQKQGR